MRIVNYALFILFFIACGTLSAQAPAYDELEFEPDSLTGVYKPSGKNYVLIKSKRGEGGVNKTAQADGILSAEVTEIVLVFSETDPGDLADREVANQERWENLLKTYPELFQFSTTYKNLCQCKINGDADAFKQSQGFYVYVNGEVPKAAVEPPKAEAPKPVAAAPKVEAKKTEEPKAETKKAEEKKAVEEKNAVKEVAVSDKTAVKTPEPPAAVKEEVKETPKQAAKETVREEPVAKESKSNSSESEPVAVAKPKVQKKAAVGKARRSKDPKACRMACYESGDESLDNFFKDNIKLTKKERRKVKKSVSILRLQLNLDGSIKKSFVTGTDEKFNAMVLGASGAMNNWNPTVKSGVTVKSEVKITLKYDKATKSIKPFEVAVTPKLAPKCKCASDAEIFGD